MDSGIADATPQEIQELASGLPKLTKKTGMKYLPMLTAGGNELILFEEGNPVLKYRPYKNKEMQGVELLSGMKTKSDELRAIQNFIENMSGNPHIVGFFGDDISLARSIELHFLAMGLYNNATCIYIFPSVPEYGTSADIKSQMVEYMKSQFGETDQRLDRLMQSFHVCNVENAIGDPEGEVNAVWRIFNDAQKLGNPPYRLVIHVYKKIATKKDYDAHLALERAVDEGFEGVQGAALCNHYRRAVTLEPELYQDWVNAMIKCHDYAFYTMNQNDSAI
jgi:hypothetical protein